ncbi:MAG: ethanolamine ammonia-lyase subunit EutC [Pseudomonadota bacterium]
MTDRAPPQSDPFARFRAVTPARIGLGRAGDALPTDALLDFQAAHAAARDAVHGCVDFDALAARLAPLPALAVRSQAESREVYLRRPDLGRRLCPDDVQRLAAQRSDWDLAIVVADGLSARAVEHQAVPLLEALLPKLTGWRLAPIVLAAQARVAIGDAIAVHLGATMVAVLIGERPGLSVADSLGVYLTWAPAPGCPDSRRNCISNIHAHGLSHAGAAETLLWLMNRARRIRASGVALKLERAAQGSLPGAS